MTLWLGLALVLVWGMAVVFFRVNRIWLLYYLTGRILEAGAMPTTTRFPITAIPSGAASAGSWTKTCDESARPSPSVSSSTTMRSPSACSPGKPRHDYAAFGGPRHATHHAAQLSVDRK